jgi:glycosyltransferase involved in cell wall biosynthesis
MDSEEMAGIGAPSAANRYEPAETQLKMVTAHVNGNESGGWDSREGDADETRRAAGTDISVIVPTRNEKGNIAVLVDRLSSVLRGRSAEVIFVDDSTDDTPETISEVASHSRLPVRCIHREDGQQVGGLGGAVLEGLRAARGSFAVVMDGDLQHPPEDVPSLLKALEAGSADLVVATRYNGAGTSKGLSNGLRMAVSRLTTLSARVVFPRKLRGVSDPMSGFFALRLRALDVGELRPIGFKILLEIVSRGSLRTDEVGFAFGARFSGESKAGLREGVRFLHHLLVLRASTLLTAQRRRAVRFGLVGAAGIGVNSAAFWVIDGRLRAHYLLAAALATQVSTTGNFIGTELFVFPGAKPGQAWRRYVSFAAVNNVVMLARLPLIVLLVNSLSTPKTLANAITLLAAFLVRFVISDRFIYEGEKPVSSPIAEQHRTQHRVGPINVEIATAGVRRSIGLAQRADSSSFRHRYSLHGIVTIGSDVKLPELEFFRLRHNSIDLRDDTATPPVSPTPDIAIRLDRLGTLRGRTRMVRSQDSRRVSWEEHLGPLSANFAVEFGEQVQVTSSRTLARSPHVLYTNVVEPLLRFVLVDRGYMLLHSACLEIDGRGVMISARTDTGKTGTVLRLLREGKGQFLSDDMTIIDGQGFARSFPKPLTISQHTLRAVDAGDLSHLEW